MNIVVMDEEYAEHVVYNLWNVDIFSELEQLDFKGIPLFFIQYIRNGTR